VPTLRRCLEWLRLGGLGAFDMVGGDFCVVVVCAKKQQISIPSPTTENDLFLCVKPECE
jgi:hypothetical protein